MLQVMLEKGLVRRKPATRGQQWSAAVTQSAAAKSMVGKLVDGVFDGSAGRLAAHLVEAGRLSDTELGELRKLIDSNRTTRKARSRSDGQSSDIQQMTQIPNRKHSSAQSRDITP